MSGDLPYVQVVSFVSPSFWSKFSELKLNVYKLDASDKPIWGFFSVPNVHETFIEVDSTSFNSSVSDEYKNGYIVFHGKIINKNTIEEFKDCDKGKLLMEHGLQLYEKITNGDAIQDPSLLNQFIVLSYADLKKYQYYYWFAFPVLRFLGIEWDSLHTILNQFSEEEVSELYEEYKKLDWTDKGYFIVTKNPVKIHTLREKLSEVTSENFQEFYFGFYNISHDPDRVGTQVRNFITLLAYHCKFVQYRIVKFIALSIRRKDGIVSCNKSSIYTVDMPDLPYGREKIWTGWEKNERDKMGPKLANMKKTLDPLVLAENAVDLNLKLMKWNLLPNINLEKIKSTKFLLLGAGTLGCSVARGLLGWGVRSVTFVDNATVSFSNPVRQSLFTYQDSVANAPKALAAAENLKLIFPDVDSKGFELTIPMPGHTVGESMLKQVEDTVTQLEKLVNEHDVIFLLMDSRESRWLPTLLGYAHDKIVINAALGFDSYLVMRHGIKSGGNREVTPGDGFKAIVGANLGCYFCNDVTAPGDSLTGRTLDQQCTVTRPGVSQIAGALATELAISLLQHDDGPQAPAFYSTCGKNLVDLDEQSVLGIIPHSIRGFLHNYQQILPATEKYTNCIACSSMIVEQYEKESFEFLLKVFNNSKYLEDVSQLTDMFKEINFNDIVELEDEDDS